MGRGRKLFTKSFLPFPNSSYFKSDNRKLNSREHGLLFHIGLQSGKGFFHQVSAHFLFVGGGEGGVAQGVGNGHGGDDAVGPHAYGNGHNRGHVHNGDIGGIFNGLGERCTATRAGSSGGGEDNRLHLGVFEALADFFSEFFS